MLPMSRTLSEYVDHRYLLAEMAALAVVSDDQGTNVAKSITDRA